MWDQSSTSCTMLDGNGRYTEPDALEWAQGAEQQAAQMYKKYIRWVDHRLHDTVLCVTWWCKLSTGHWACLIYACAALITACMPKSVLSCALRCAFICHQNTVVSMRKVAMTCSLQWQAGALLDSCGCGIIACIVLHWWTCLGPLLRF